MCNLCEIDASKIETQEDFDECSRAASFIGTLQAGYTDFHYLRAIWKKTVEKDALLGVSMTGISGSKVLDLDMKRAANVVKEENERVAKLIGINKSSRTTAIKPAGSTSSVLGTSSGIHAWHDKFYIRRIRLGKDEAIYSYLKEVNPAIVEDEKFRPETMAVVSLPMEAPEGADTRDEKALDLLSRVKKVTKEWIHEGHRKGVNKHNCSVTVSIRDEEWDEVGEWMWNNRDIYTGISVLPFDGGTYVQAPFESIDEEQFNELSKQIKPIDMTQVREDVDHTNLQGELACSGNQCEIV